MQPIYKRVLLKISGEALAGTNGFGLDFDVIGSIGKQVKKCVSMGVQVAIVVGGGNFWRGRTGENMDRTRADHMGMLATAINSLAIADSLEEAVKEAYRLADGVQFKNAYRRSDIGQRGLAAYK